MPGELVPIIIIPAFFWMIYVLTKTISDNRVRRLLVDKEVPSDVIEQVFLRQRGTDMEANLKWGIISVLIGVAFAVVHVLNLDADEAMTYAVMFIFGGGGLLIFYALKQDKADA